MTWNWQSRDWPNFTWDRSRISGAEEQFLFAAGVTVGTVRQLSAEQHKQFLVQSMDGEALATSAMEGEVLDPACVRSFLSHQFGLESREKRHTVSGETGIAEMMVELYRSFAHPLSEEILFAWHRMISASKTELTDVGRYRTRRERMRLISGPADAPTVHFEAPPARQIPVEMKRFVAWFNRAAAPGREVLPAVTRAGISLLFFNSIHPFEDGNGQMGRAIAQKALMQGFVQPVLVALAPAMLSHRGSYYQTIVSASLDTDITGWLAWFADIALQAQRRTLVLVEFILAQNRLLERLHVEINERQLKVLTLMFCDGPEGYSDGMTAGHYSTITGASPATTTRDLADLVEKGALLRSGERKHARYRLNVVAPVL